MRHVPLESLTIGNLWCDEVGPEDTFQPAHYGWHCAERTRFRSLGIPGRIRRDWFDLLPPDLHQFPDPSMGRWYATEEQANAAVGFAALNWAREQAGLPLLVWTVVRA
jgi:hypothetical protein